MTGQVEKRKEKASKHTEIRDRNIIEIKERRKPREKGKREGEERMGEKGREREKKRKEKKRKQTHQTPLTGVVEEASCIGDAQTEGKLSSCLIGFQC